MRLRSVNVSGIIQVMHQGALVDTGIFKKPVDGPVAVGPTQLIGDKQADLRNHGGPDKAVYGYPWEHYASWANLLDRHDFTLGQFGENLTTEGLLETELSIGDRLRVGSALLEVSQPRMPCFKLGIRMKLPEFPKLLTRSGRVGFYFRVLEEGLIQPGDTLVVEPVTHNRVSIQEVNHVRFFEPQNIDAIERILRNPALAAVWRKDFEDLRANHR